MNRPISSPDKTMNWLGNNRTVRHKWFDQYFIETVAAAQVFATEWFWTYNNERPNRAIGTVTPARKLTLAG